MALTDFHFQFHMAEGLPEDQTDTSEYWLVSVGVYASPPHIPSKTCKSKFAQ